jgi:hypothetical protein
MKTNFNFLHLFLFLAIAIFVVSCTKEETATTGPAGPAGPSLSGSLKGHIFCYDQYGVPVLVNLSKIGMKDSLNGTNNVVHPDSTGAYTFSTLTTGNYSFTISANSYGMTEVENLQFVGGGTLIHDVKISQIPSFNVLTCYDSIAPASDTNVYIKGTVPPDIQVRTIAIFVGSNSSVSSSPSTYLDYFSASTKATGTTFSIAIPKTTFNNLGIAAGSTAYIAAYGAAVNYTSASEYEDITTGRTIFNALSSTPYTTSFPVP